MRVLFALCLFTVAFSAKLWEAKTGVNFDDSDALKAAFEEWKNDFEVSYADTEAESKAFLTFIDNWRMVVDHNDQGFSFTMKLNQFADLTGDDFRMRVHGHTGSCLSRRVPPEAGSEFDPSLAMINVPDSVDWTTKGVVTPIKNQGQCGSCWAFSTTGSIECRTAIKTGKLVSLSEQQLVDCSRAEGNLGCNGGLMDDAFKYVKKEGGLCTEQEYPYEARDGTCRAASCGTKYDDISGYVDVTAKSESALQAAAAEGCVSVAIEADQSSFQFYSSGVLDGRCGTRLDHGVLIVGYGTQGGKDYWKVKNSWGKSWGEDGYVLVCRNCNKNNGQGECGILDQPSYPTI